MNHRAQQTHVGRLLGKDGCKGKDVGSTKKEQGEKGRLLVGWRRVGAVGERGRGGGLGVVVSIMLES